MKLSVSVYSRRSFMRVTSATFFTVMFALSSACNLGKSRLEQIGQRMIGTLNHIDRARLIGSLYIEQTPGAQKLNFGQWTEKILAVLKIDPENISEDDLHLLEKQIRKRVRQDFVQEDIVIVKGYMFSNLEIMLCSLAAAYPQS